MASPLPLTGELERERARTYPGQASWGGAVAGKTCRECQHWSFVGYLAGGVIKAGPCDKASMMMNMRTKPVPDYANACSYFVDNPKAPPRYKGET